MTLGRGLASLIPPPSDNNNLPKNADQNSPLAVGSAAGRQPERDPAATPPSSATPEIKTPAAFPPKNHRPFSEAVFHIETDKIRPNPHQPRKEFSEESLKELAASIREFGVIQPLVVSKIEKETDGGTAVEYELIAGERRLMASKIAGLERVPVIVRKIDTQKERLELAIIENIQRADLNPIETARAFAKLQDEFRMTQREIAVRLGKSRETVANAIRLLSLPTDIQEALGRGQINEGQARILLMVDDIARQQALFGDLLANNLSVRELRSRVKKSEPPSANEDGKISGQAPVADPETSYLRERLEEALGTRVSIQKSGDQGKISIAFFSPEELDGIIRKITGQQQAE
ncbi:MAG: ParB/RepB/Spo0J family partition protein [Parcubacteria group bacterium]|nr:ParB/RepB/Spo0J family partition protein [Parcubacteria group bacterium]